VPFWEWAKEHDLSLTREHFERFSAERPPFVSPPMRN
jgi:hypothetical protein